MTKSHKAPRELDLKIADEMLNEYRLEHSTIDSGNLFFAAMEYRAAYESLQAQLEIAVKAHDSISRNTCCETCQEAALWSKKALDDIAKLKEGAK